MGKIRSQRTPTSNFDDLSETLLEAEGGWDDKDNASLRRKQRQEKEDEDEDEELEFGTVMKTLSGHEDAILCLDFNHPKGILVSSSLDGTVRAWDLQLNQCIGMLEGHSSTVRCLQLDNARLFTGSDDGTIRHWDLTAIPPIRSPTSMDSFSNFSSAPSSPTLSTVTAAEDLVPSFNDGGLGVFQGHTGEITALYTDHQTIVSGSNDRTMKQWDIETQQCILTLDVQWASKGGNTSFSSGWDTLAALENWTLDSLRYTNFERSSDYIGALQFWNFALANGTVDGKIRMWDLRTGQAHRTLPGHNAAVTCLQFDEVHLVSGSADKTIRIWDLRTGSVFDTLTYEGPVTSLQFDAGKIISGSNSAQIDIYNRTSFQHTSLVGHSEPVNSIRFRNNVLASGSRDHAIKLWAL
ncbi:WD40-repeat-containing domain protein [Radiomyces spectabilis]|uniref:WD40-repeat-containing domain protein n=1 Tax=Radiomyces spectabilis TaxID=64574 RepID=UPI00221EED53|nr:WD40-repeat-containing domain protein [Radiomyces spectabilis]KAI8365907.1 WD40-repeat-containing domain protein [Radiomyces spectabilis]